MRDVVLLGSTGSIGTQTLEVIDAHSDGFRVVGLSSGGGNLDLLVQQAHAFSPDVADDLPYVLVTVDMADRVRVLGRLEGAPPSLGLPVRLGFRDAKPVFSA